MLKDQNAAQDKMIKDLKMEVKELELNKAKFESEKADLEYNLRAAEYNVEIIKNQLENVNTEMALVKAQNEKQAKTTTVLRQAYHRMKSDLEYQRSGSGKKGGKRQRSLNQTPMAGGKSKKAKKKDLLNMSANIQPEFNTEAMVIDTPSDMVGLLNQSAMLSPFALASPLTANAESQADLIDFKEMIRLEERVKVLEEQLEERNKLIDTLEKKMEGTQKG